MTARHIAGLDLSTTRIGYAAPDGTLTSIVSRFDAKAPTRRLDDLWRQMERTIRLHPPIPDLVAIEGYALSTGPHTGGLARIRLGEIGGLARVMLFQLGIEYVEIPPSSLKRWATGNGRADKGAMIAAARASGASGTVNHDEADAWHCRRMARMAHGLEEKVHDYQIDALTKIDW